MNVKRALAIALAIVGFILVIVGISNDVQAVTSIGIVIGLAGAVTNRLATRTT